MATKDFSEHYGEYWQYVKDSIDSQGWAYSNQVPHMLDFYFEANTKKPIEVQRSYEGEYRGMRWRPKSITEY